MAIWDLLGGVVGLYKVVPPDEAHVRIMFDKKELFMARDKLQRRSPDPKTGKDIIVDVPTGAKPSYWQIPFVTKVSALPLSNIRIDVPDVKLNDSDMAKFQCDIVCFVNISDPILAAERTGITIERSRFEGRVMGIDELSHDFSAIMESIIRTVATKQTILDIYKDRSKLDAAVTKEVEAVFPRWGLELVDLEIKDIKDVANSTIIADIERKIAAEITAAARIKMAQANRDASVAEAIATQDAESKRAETEQIWKTKRVESEREVEMRKQEAAVKVAEKRKEANTKDVEAQRMLDVGKADISRQVTEQNANASKLKLSIEAEGYNTKRKLEAEADSEYTKQTRLAEAAGIEKVAEAQQKFKDGSIEIERIKADMAVRLKMAEAYQHIGDNANINIMTDSSTALFEGGLLGEVKAGAKSGYSLANFLRQNPQAANLLGVPKDKLKDILKGDKDAGKTE